MKKFSIIVVLVFAVCIGAEWFMFGAPRKGVVLSMQYQTSDDYKLNVLTSEGTTMEIRLPSKTWRDWLEPRTINEK